MYIYIYIYTRIPIYVHVKDSLKKKMLQDAHGILTAPDETSEP